ncbi:MAG: efflux RND transporter periplasmic adaptor subunit [Spirulinaceae cyanobacterium]
MNNQPKDNQHLRVVNPRSKATRDSQPAEEENQQPGFTDKKTFPTRSLLIGGSILIVLGAVSQIPHTPNVRAEAWLEPNPQASEVVHMQVPGKITEILVQPNKTIEANQPIALIATEQLEEEKVDWDLRLQESVSNNASSRQQVNTAAAKLEQARNVEKEVRDRTFELQEELNFLKSGSPPAHIQALQQEVATLQKSIMSMDESIGSYSYLRDEGAISQEQVREIERRKLSLQVQISDKQGNIANAERQLVEELQDKQEELSRLETNTVVATEELAAAQTNLQQQQPILKQVQKEQKRREEQISEQKVLRTSKAGKVITPDLYTLQGKTLEKGEPVLEIADSSELIAVIEVRQEEADLVTEGAIVTFSPVEPGLKSFTTEIEEIEPVLERDEQLSKSIQPVKARVGSQNSDFKPGAKVFAKIKSTETIPLYQLAWREVLNLFKIRRYS